MGSDYCPIKVTINVIGNCLRFYNSSTFTDWNAFKQHLPYHPTEDINTINIEEFSLFINKSISDSYAKSTTSKDKSNNNKLPIHVHKLIIRKKKAKNRAKKTKDPKDKNKFNILNSIVKQEITSLYSKNWTDFIDNLNKSSISSKPFWDKINMFRNGKKSNSTIPTLVDNNISYKSDSEKANLFGSRLENIFSDSNDSRFDNLFKSKVENEVVIYFHRTNTKFNNQPYITINDLNKAIKSLNNKSSPGQDNITNKHLKNLSEGFKKIVLDLFNETIKQGKTPTQWKESIVTMIPKKSNVITSDYVITFLVEIYMYMFFLCLKE